MAETRTVLVTDCDMGPADLERAVLEPAGWSVVEEQCRTAQDVVAAVAQHRPAGLLVQYAPVTREVLTGWSRQLGARGASGGPGVGGGGVPALVRYGVGMDVVDVAAAAELGISAEPVLGYGSAEVADHAVTLLLSLLRGVPLWSVATREGRWPSLSSAPRPVSLPVSLPVPRELSACTLGLLGFGAIAREVARRAGAFGMTVLAADPFVDDAAVAAAGVEPVTAEELWTRSTAVSLHVPLTAETRGAVGPAQLEAMAPGSFLVNTARGGLVDRAALEAALASGRLAGAGLDVWWDEPADPGDPLLRDPRVLVTPHVAWLSPGSVRRLRTGAARQLLAALGG